MCTIVSVQFISKYYLPFTLSKQFLPSKYSHDWLLNRIYKIIYTHDIAVLCAFVMILSFIMDSCDSCIDVRHGSVIGSRTIIVFPQCEWSNLSGHGFDRPYPNHTKQQQKREPCSLFLGLPYLSSSLEICEMTDEIKHYVHCQHSLYENRIRYEGSLPDH